jgi:thiamine transport system permease protein
MDSFVDRNRVALSNTLKNITGYAILGLPLVFLAIFFVYPLGAIFGYSFQLNGEWDLSGFGRIISTAYYRDTLFFSVYQAVLSTLLTVGLAIPVAYVFVRYQFWGKRVWLALLNLPFVLPTVVVATGFSALLGKNGILNTMLMRVFALETAPIQLERTLTLIIMAHIFYNFALVLRLIVGYWSNQSLRLEEAARVMGASEWRLWHEIRLPLLRPIIVSSALLVFIFTFTSFGVVLILGGIRFATLEVQIYYQTVTLLDLPMAGALSLMQIVLVGMVMLFYTRLQQRFGLDLRRSNAIAQRPLHTRTKFVVYSILCGLLVLLCAPLLALVWLSFTVNSDGFTLAYYTGLFENTRRSILFVSPIVAVGHSLFFALITTVLATLLGTIVAYMVFSSRSGWMRVVDVIFLLPLAVSAVTLGFGYLISLDKPPLNLRSSWLIVPIAHTLVAMPFVIRSVLPSLRAIPPSLLHAAKTLGAGRWRVWQEVQLPLISRSLVVGMVFTFTVSMGEFGASLFVARPDTPTIPIAIYRLISQPRGDSYGQALAMSVILMLVCAMSFLLIERLREAGVGEF